MSQAQHTPGPWFATTCTFDKKTWKELHGEEFTVLKEAPYDAVLFASNVVALIWADDDKEEKATAHLIAAAPDLLEILEEIVDSDIAMREEDEGRISPILDKARVVIAKARGQS